MLQLQSWIYVGVERKVFRNRLIAGHCGIEHSSGLFGDVDWQLRRNHPVQVSGVPNSRNTEIARISLGTQGIDQQV